MQDLEDDVVNAAAAPTGKQRLGRLKRMQVSQATPAPGKHDGNGTPDAAPLSAIAKRLQDQDDRDSIQPCASPMQSQDAAKLQERPPTWLQSGTALLLGSPASSPTAAQREAAAVPQPGGSSTAVSEPGPDVAAPTESAAAAPSTAAAAPTASDDLEDLEDEDVEANEQQHQQESSQQQQDNSEQQQQEPRTHQHADSADSSSQQQLGDVEQEAGHSKGSMSISELRGTRPSSASPQGQAWSGYRDEEDELLDNLHLGNRGGSEDGAEGASGDSGADSEEAGSGDEEENLLAADPEELALGTQRVLREAAERDAIGKGFVAQVDPAGHQTLLSKLQARQQQLRDKAKQLQPPPPPPPVSLEQLKARLEQTQQVALQQQQGGGGDAAAIRTAGPLADTAAAAAAAAATGDAAAVAEVGAVGVEEDEEDLIIEDDQEQEAGSDDDAASSECDASEPEEEMSLSLELSEGGEQDLEDSAAAGGSSKQQQRQGKQQQRGSRQPAKQQGAVDEEGGLELGQDAEGMEVDEQEADSEDLEDGSGSEEEQEDEEEDGSVDSGSSSGAEEEEEEEEVEPEPLNYEEEHEAEAAALEAEAGAAGVVDATAVLLAAQKQQKLGSSKDKGKRRDKGPGRVAGGFIEAEAELSEEEGLGGGDDEDEEEDGDDGQLEDLIGTVKETRFDDQVRAVLHKAWEQEEEVAGIRKIVDVLKNGRKRGRGQHMDDDEDDTDAAARRRRAQLLGTTQDEDEDPLPVRDKELDLQYDDIIEADDVHRAVPLWRQQQEVTDGQPLLPPELNEDSQDVAALLARCQSNSQAGTSSGGAAAPGAAGGSGFRFSVFGRDLTNNATAADPQVSFLGRQQSSTMLVKAASNFGSSRSFVFATDPNASNHGSPPGSPAQAGALADGSSKGPSRLKPGAQGPLGPSSFAGLRGMIGSGTGSSGGGGGAAAAAGQRGTQDSRPGAGLSRAASGSSRAGSANLFDLLKQGDKPGGAAAGGQSGASLNMHYMAVMNAKFSGKRRG